MQISNLQTQQFSRSQQILKNLVHISKLAAYISITGTIILGSISTLGWSLWADTVLASVAAGAAVITTAWYSISENIGIYWWDGKQAGNIELITKIKDKTGEDINIQKSSGIDIMLINAGINTLAILFALTSIALNIPAKADTEHKGVWYLGIPAMTINIIAAIALIFAHQFTANKLRKIQKDAIDKLDNLKTQEHSDAIADLQTVIQAKDTKITSLKTQLQQNTRQLTNMRRAEIQTRDMLQEQIAAWQQQLTRYQGEDRAHVRFYGTDRVQLTLFSTAEKSQQLSDKINKAKAAVEKLTENINTSDDVHTNNTQLLL